MELVVHDPRPRQVGAQALGVRLPHIHARRPHPPAPGGRQRGGEEPIQRLAFPVRAHPEWLPGLEVAHHGEKLRRLPQKDLVHAEITQRGPRPLRGPLLQGPLVELAHRLGGEAPARGYPPDRGVGTVPHHRRGKPGRVVPRARHAREPFPAPPAAPAGDRVDLDDQPDGPGPPGESPHPPLAGRPLRRLGADAAPPAAVVGPFATRPHPEGEGLSVLIDLLFRDSVPRQGEQSC